MPVSFLGAPRTLYVPPSIHWRAAPAVSALVYRLTISGRLPPALAHGGLGGCSGAAHHPGQPNPPAVAGEDVAIEAGGSDRILDPVGHLADREPEHPVSIPRVLRPDGVQGPKAGRGDGHHGALALLVGL